MARTEAQKEARRRYKKDARVRMVNWVVKQTLLEPINTRRKKEGKSRIGVAHLSQDDVFKYKRYLEKRRELKNQKEMKNTVTKTKEEIYKTRSEGQKKAWEKRRAKLSSVKEYEATAVIGVEKEPIVEEAVTKQPEMDIVTEFKKLEARRLEILNEVEIFNEYVESLKIKLV